MKAISIKQPWASLIVSGLKDIENRTWKTNFRRRALIHAEKTRERQFSIPKKLNELKDKAYQYAIERGWHEKEHSNCHWLCLVASELMGAVQADIKGRRANRKSFKSDYEDEEPHDDYNFRHNFDKYIKDSVEDKLADACIRLLDLAGLRNIDIFDFTEEEIEETAECCIEEAFTEVIYAISTIPTRRKLLYGHQLKEQLKCMMLAIFGLAKYLNIDILWHIEQKMRYNELTW